MLVNLMIKNICNLNIRKLIKQINGNYNKINIIVLVNKEIIKPTGEYKCKK